MTALMTDSDLELLLGDAEELQCEHSAHTTDKAWHDDGPAKYYARHEHCRGPVVLPVCERWAQVVIFDFDRAGRCGQCMKVVPLLKDIVKIVGLINA